MRIALNALYVGDGVAGGWVYRDGLLRGLAGWTPQISSTCSPGDRRRCRDSQSSGSTQSRLRFLDGVRSVGLHGNMRSCRARVRRGKYDLYHALGSLSPRIRRVPVILTIHDLIYRHFPSSVPPGYRLFMRAVQPRAARQADRIIVDSHFVAREVVELLWGPGRAGSGRSPGSRPMV